jgi:hypothetical protein
MPPAITDRRLPIADGRLRGFGSRSTIRDLKSANSNLQSQL